MVRLYAAACAERMALLFTGLRAGGRARRDGRTIWTLRGVGHAALTATGMLDQNLTGNAFRTEEQLLQSLSVSDPATDLWSASVTVGRERFRAVRGRMPASAR
ncbi:hypothetical protein KNE206_76950 [Kitasatospora sp. NE20-6]